MRRLIHLATIASLGLGIAAPALAMERPGNFGRTPQAELNRLLSTHIFTGRPLQSEVLAVAGAERGRDTRHFGQPGRCSFVYEGRARRKVMTCTTL